MPTELPHRQTELLAEFLTTAMPAPNYFPMNFCAVIDLRVCSREVFEEEARVGSAVHCSQASDYLESITLSISIHLWFLGSIYLVAPRAAQAIPQVHSSICSGVGERLQSAEEETAACFACFATSSMWRMGCNIHRVKLLTSSIERLAGPPEKPVHRTERHRETIIS